MGTRLAESGGMSATRLRFLSVYVAITLSFFVRRAYAQDVPILWNARFSTLVGDLRCSYGDQDCNRCAYDVEGQFRRMARDGKMKRNVRSWHWNYGQSYFPKNANPSSIVTLFPSGHFQSVARVPAGFNELLATWGGGERGIFVVKQGVQPNGKLSQTGDLKYLFDGTTNHPGGLQGIGKYAVIATDESPAFIDIIDASVNPPVRTVSLAAGQRMANLGIAKLAGGGYVILSTTTSKENGYVLWYTASLKSPHLEKMWESSVTADRPVEGLEYKGYEGLSLVTECGTGRIYAVGMTAPATGLIGAGDGYWALYSLLPTPQLIYRMRNSVDMNHPACMPRAGGSAFVGRHGELAFYCHQKGQDEHPLISWVTCEVSAGALVTSILTGDLAVGALSGWLAHESCSAIALGNDEIAFTELWPTEGTPETPPSNQRQVTVRIDVGQTGGDCGVTSVLDLANASSCQTASGIVECSWPVAAGELVTLLPMHGPNVGALWTDATCDGENESAEASTCTFTAWNDTVVELRATCLL